MINLIVPHQKSGSLDYRFYIVAWLNVENPLKLTPVRQIKVTPVCHFKMTP